MADSTATAAAVASALRFFDEVAPRGPLLLINNSGFGSYGPFPAGEVEGQCGQVRVNAEAPVRLVGLLLPALRARGGAIVNVASTAGFLPTPWMATYGATKAFLLHWSLALGEDLRGTGIRVLAVCPGPTRSDFFRRAGWQSQGLPGGFPPMLAEAVAAGSLRALQRGRRLYVAGWHNSLLARLGSKLPKPVAAFLAGRVLAAVRPLPHPDRSSPPAL